MGEGAILDWVNGQGGVAIISSDMGTSIAKVGDNFTESIERKTAIASSAATLVMLLPGSR